MKKKMTPIVLCVIGLITLGTSTATSDRPAPIADPRDTELSYASDNPEGRVPAPTPHSALTVASRPRALSFDVRPLPVLYADPRGTSEDPAGGWTPLSLASDDFDDDGVPDLLCGYTGAEGSLITLQRGNVDAIFPFSAAARERRATGTWTNAPFLPADETFEVALRPDYLAVGDFDNDGKRDVVVGANDALSLRFLAGDGSGGLQDAGSIPLPGPLTTMIAGDVNRRDGLVDLVVAVDGAEGPVALVFEGAAGAFQAEPEVIELPAPAIDLALAPLTSYSAIDLVIGTEGQLLIVKGRDRKTYLSARRQAEVGPPEIVQIHPAAPVRAVAAGDLTLESPGFEIAALLDDGAVRLFGSGDTADSWTIVDEQKIAAPTVAPRSLQVTRLSGAFTDDLVILDTSQQRLAALGANTNIGSVDLEAPPIALLPMRLSPDALMDLLVLTEDGKLSVVRSAPRAVITVDTAADTAVAGDAACSLREAIGNANADTDTTGGDCTAGSGADTIAFNVGGGGSVAIIDLTSALPDIVDAVTIDGGSQACTIPPCVELRGAAAGVGVNGLTVTAGSSTVRGLVIRDFDNDGIYLQSSGNFVEGNFIGTDQRGRIAAGNGVNGIHSEGQDNTIGGTAPDAGNLVSANGDAGIRITGPTGTADVVQGNYIGTSASGTAGLPNGSSGIVCNWSAGNLIGGTSETARNLVSGNDSEGIRIDQAEAIGNLVQGNYIGTKANGTVVLGNVGAGVAVLNGASYTTIGGAGVGARNLISGNENGVVLFSEASDNLVVGNYIGTDFTGTADLGNLYHGVHIQDASDNIVGAVLPGPSNLISGNNKNGVFIELSLSTSNAVLGNYIGTDITGTSALGNGSGGVVIRFDASDNTVGGTDPGARNIISGHTAGFGVTLWAGATNNTVLGNFIGTDVTGTVPMGNLDGVQVWGAPYNTIGGDGVGAGNVISASEQYGIDIHDPDSIGNEILGNLIGTDVNGEVALGNGIHGIFLDGAPDNSIGGTSAGAGNVVSGNLGSGIVLYTDSNSNAVQGNFIGTNAAGTAALGNTNYGVSLQGASDNAVVDNVISANGRHGVIIWYLTSDNRVQGNLIGTDVTGTVALGNLQRGVNIQNNSENTLVGGTSPEERNVISGNGWQGVYLSALLPNNNIVGNLIGTDITGTVALGNSGNGIMLNGDYGGASDNEIADNLISGNQEEGVTLILGANRNLLLGNRVGTDITGTLALGNLSSGIDIQESNDNVIGGTAAEAANLISGNAGNGVNVNLSDGNQILGNYIGTDASGMAALGNGLSGVFAQDSTNTMIGGTAFGARNLVSGGSGDGVVVVGSLSSGNQILGNLIGADATGAPALGNSGAGVGIVDGPGNTIGGTVAGAGNLIAGNADEGIVVLGTSAVSNSILGNSIFANGFMGIDLNWPDGVTPNDPGDLDTGPNQLQNFPDLTSVNASPAGVVIEGSLNSLPSTNFRVEFFTSTVCDSSGYGEGERYLGFDSVTTDVSGNGTFTASLSSPVSNGDFIATTVTDAAGNTSEFCGCVTVSCDSLVTFGSVMLGQDATTWVWGTPQDVRFVKGDLDAVDTYSILDDGTLLGAVSLDMSMDHPAPGNGLFYLVRPLGCGSWQNDPGSDPGRDPALP